MKKEVRAAESCIDSLENPWQVASERSIIITNSKCSALKEKLLLCLNALLTAFVVAIAGVGAAALVGAWAVPLAYQERGYWAVGGEGLLMILAAFLGIWAAWRVIERRR